MDSPAVPIAKPLYSHKDWHSLSGHSGYWTEILAMLVTRILPTTKTLPPPNNKPPIIWSKVSRVGYLRSTYKRVNKQKCFRNRFRAPAWKTTTAKPKTTLIKSGRNSTLSRNYPDSKFDYWYHYKLIQLFYLFSILPYIRLGFTVGLEQYFITRKLNIHTKYSSRWKKICY